MRLLLTVAASLAFSAPVFADDHAMSEKTSDLTFERVFASPSLDGASPRQAKLSPDGRYLTLLRNREDERERYDLWGYDRKSGEWTMLVDSEKLGTGRELSEDEKMQRERARVGNLKGIISYQWTADGSGILVPLDGDLYLAKLDGSVTRLTDTEESELNPVLSSTSKYASFIRDRQLWVGEVGGEAAPITPKEGDTIRWGEAEFVAQEEMSRMTGYWWNPNDTRIAVQRTDEERVGIVTRAAIGATGTKVFDQRYPVAGSDNAVVELFVMDPDGGEQVQVDLTSNQDPAFYNADDPTDFYIARVDWSPNGMLYVQRQNREQTVLDMLQVDPATGKSDIWFTEKAAADEYWINLSDSYKFLQDGSLIWWSERDGFGHIYRLADGTWTQLTGGKEPVTKLVGVNEELGRIYYSQGRDVLEQHIYVGDYTGEMTDVIVELTERGFTHSAVMDKQATTLFVSRSNHNQPMQSYLADGSGKRLAWVEENALDADHPYAPHLASHRPAKFGTIKAADGTTDLHYKMVTPDMEPGKKYPVFYYHYSGPGPQIVTKGWDGALQQAVVDAGYIWFELDNRGSANRGVAFEQPLYHAMGGVEVHDQAKGTEYLKALDFVDPDKVAIYGWSYGGYMTLKRMQAYPGVYAAGISGAPVTRWGLYDTHYTERFMGDPRKVPEAYEKASAIPDADKMTDPLLLIHGMADDNVVFEHSSELIAKMQASNQPFEMMLYPGYTHRVAGEQISPHLWNTIFAFLKKHGVTPPE
ncbi:DPP IV N-terminal domain-containing protein [Pontixanthobacter aestiaquae]|uniref:Prolyl oligopeptidase family serine peptidase n=1 Tax=Pontixanthobacter aestiaquae TaxID=1509367 RepID=A0A844Z9Y4_9SPHN|nr:S9 family peptidase [Pontixanthobacter aestiaquae]MDN3645167.1 DPP IV N-terminal domain-containing protein [Pontixanthobacter aestiaquae]MXO83833.1 prolyl oligopeptidase family serine peptidase [Pontixanthobacter aestiaquae]